MDRKSEPTKYSVQAKERIAYIINVYCNGSQQQLSEKTGINKGSISQYVNGRNVPSNITAKKIADCFNIEPAWVMGFDVPMERKASSSAAVHTHTLTPDESDLIDDYRELNAYGKDEARNHMHYLASQERYKKQQNATDSLQGAG